MFLADSAAGLAIVAAWAQWLPAIAAAVGAVWYGVQIYESITIQRLIKKITPNSWWIIPAKEPTDASKPPNVRSDEETHLD